MRKLQFFGLPRSLQDRFIEASLGSAVPAPLLVSRIGSREYLLWTAGAVAIAGGWAAFTVHGFGDLESPLALAPPLFLAAHAAFAAGVVFCALTGWAKRWESMRTPYPAGTYLFPAGVIQAKQTELLEYDVAGLSDVVAQGSEVSVKFVDGSSFRFDAGGVEQAAQAVQALERGREQWKELGIDDALERARLNPLVDSGVPNPLAPTTPHQRQVFLGSIAKVVATVAMACLLGWAVWWWRNELSAEALFERAQAEDTVEAYQAYLTRGGERRDVADVLLPRAELVAAREDGSVEAIEKFIAEHPDTKIGAEVQEAHRTALLAALEEAKKKGTVAAIEALPKKYAGHTLIAGEIAAARHAVFEKALQAFKQQASPKNAELVPFVTRLVQYTEKHGPVVDVRWSHQFKQEAEEVDKIVMKSRKYYAGQKSLPSQYFLGDHARRREKELGERLVARLQKAFPKDVVEFRFVGPAGSENEELTQPKAPTITLIHSEKISGGFVGGKPRVMFMGASIWLRGIFEIPQQKGELDFQWRDWRRPSVKIYEEDGKSFPDVYEEMLGGAFEKFGNAYLRNWFKEP